MFFLKQKRKKENERGFSLIELLVVLALLVIILSISLFNYNRFGKEVELENSAYSIALAVRETQTFGINKKARDNVLTAFSDIQESFGQGYGYGIHFRKTRLNGGTDLDNKHFAFFIDSDGGDKKLTGTCTPTVSPAPPAECYSVVTIEKGNYISDIQVLSPRGWIAASGPNQSLDIYFKRPNPDATIISSSTEYSRARITIKDSTSTYQRCIEVGIAGDVTIKKHGC